ncbi:MAG TPA: outer membrane beta-barrel protein [Hanamia sp.]|nr:outer membrane beta-barrel protein [Hanamia sp.]
MKRIMTLAISFLCFFTATAQTEKGRVVLSANTDMSMMFGKTTLLMDSTTGEKQSSKAFNANIGFAYFVANNLAIGINGSFQYKRVDADNSIGYLHSYTAGIIPAITYFFPLKGNIKPNISVGAGYLWYFTSNLDAEGLSLNVAPGVSYFVNRNISLDLGVQYSHNNLKNTSGHSDISYKQEIIAILAGLSIYFK